MKSLKQSVLFAVMAVLVAMIAFAPAQAQSDVRASIDVPFDFVLGDRTLKAGTYRVEKQESGVLVFTNEDTRSTQFATAVRADAFDDHEGKPYLVFVRYGNEAFLKQVAFNPDVNYELVLSGSEKRHIDNLESGEQVGLVQRGR